MELLRPADPEEWEEIHAGDVRKDETALQGNNKFKVGRMNEMLLKKAERTLAYGKIGIFGFQGSGKTYTSTLIIIGLCKLIGCKQVAFFDTETGSDWLIEMLEKEGLEVFQVKSRSFNDLMQFIRECEENKIPGIVDSITHVWRELCDSYDKKLKRNGRLQFQDWAIIKREWNQYTDLFVNSKVHLIVCGRAGYEYDNLVDEQGNKELLKTGTKMKAESEFGFEPHLVIEMERVVAEKEALINEPNKTKRQSMKVKSGSTAIHRAHILKDRSDLLDGQSFDDPTFEQFQPHFMKLNLGGNHLGVDTTRTSEDRFDTSGRPEWKKEQEQKQIALEEMKGVVDLYFPGSTKEERRAKIRLSEEVFKTTSGTKIESMPLNEIEIGVQRIKAILDNRDNVNLLLSEAGGKLITVAVDDTSDLELA